MLLSICIPTYNGAKYIRKNINKIQLPLHKNYYIEKISSQGAFKQFMNGCVYEDIYNVYSDYFNKKQYKTRRNKKYLKYLSRMKNKKIVPFGRYLGDVLYCQNLLKGKK